MPIQKPFLKWVGGKTQLLHILNNYTPKHINNYREIFLGGGSMLLSVLTLINRGDITITGKVYAYDINEGLINVYKQVQSNKDELYIYLQSYIDEYDSITGNVINRKPTIKDEAITSKESYYYWIRGRFNNMEKDTVEYAALFIFLNKTCFRGMYREGPSGFNVPYGHYKTTSNILSKDELNRISELIKDVEFICCDFSHSISSTQKDDYLYLDPPYVPENTRSFVSYNKGGFDRHLELFEKVKELRGVKFCMSNSNMDIVRGEFDGYKIEEVIARRAINSKNPGAKATEVIISN